ncbi:hypothetical protein C7U57_28795 [Pseudomonas sp. R9.37]|nr:hypothetical protein C7U57_28795 [Pseudomonas sp. R9.37]
MGAGLPVMQAPRSVRYTRLMLSQASQLSPLTEYKRAAPIYRMHCDPTVGAGLLAKAVVQSAHVSLTHRLREQARSHKLTAFSCQHRTAWLFCGRWLACDAGTSVCQVHRVDAIAGKPAPTFDRVQTTPIYLMHCDPTVGAGLLAKAVVQSAHVSLTHRFASKPAPTS